MEETSGQVSDLENTLETNAESSNVAQNVEAGTSGEHVPEEVVVMAKPEENCRENATPLKPEEPKHVSEDGLPTWTNRDTQEPGGQCSEEDLNPQPEDGIEEHKPNNEIENSQPEDATENSQLEDDIEIPHLEEDIEEIKENTHQTEDDINVIRKINENAQKDNEDDPEEIQEEENEEDPIFQTETAEEDKLPPLKSKDPKLGTARYYTMRSMYRGKDQERIRAKSLAPANEVKPDIKEIADVKLPLLELETTVNPTSSRFPAGLSTNYVENYKSFLKLRGIKFEDVFTHNRNKAERALLRDADRRRQQALPAMSKHKPKRHAGMQSDPQSRLSGDCSDADDVPSLGSAASVFGSMDKVDDTGREESDLERKLHDVMKAYSDTPGYRKKKPTTARKLGNVVSSQRLSQLLESNEPLRMENFYNYYP